MFKRSKFLLARSSFAVWTALVWCATLMQPSYAQSDTKASGDGVSGVGVSADVGAGWNILSIHASAFDFATNIAYETGYLRFPTTTDNYTGRASVQLPTGAEIGRIGLFARDSDSTVSATVLAQLWRHTGYGSTAGAVTVPPASELIADVEVTVGAPGHHYSRSNLNPPHTVDNYVLGGGGQYEVTVFVRTTPNGIMGFRGVELWWKRQISPPPSVASFVDVPTTHQFFREIEALAAAGITLGCTATQYCPNATVTRAQMAAFFARALGLYWQY